MVTRPIDAEEWEVRLAAAVQVHRRRVALRAAARGEAKRARALGLPKRTARRLRLVRSRPENNRTEGAPT